MNSMNGWYQPPQAAQPNNNQGVFTAFVDNEFAAQNYPVPVNGMVVLVDLQSGKMWIKSTTAPVRAFTIKEIPMVGSAGVDVVTKEEFTKSFNDIQNQLSKITEMLNAQKGDAVK